MSIIFIKNSSRKSVVFLPKKKTTAVASEGKKFRSCAEKIKLWRKSSESKNPGEITHFDDENLML
jgi:hypothetical protein